MGRAMKSYTLTIREDEHKTLFCALTYWLSQFADAEMRDELPSDINEAVDRWDPVKADNVHGRTYKSWVRDHANRCIGILKQACMELLKEGA